ncbi:hypothetical protein BC827DRAFT_1170023 [Russula dissimulans]|nr:hypothetical protein BC827DRAFT_1170023 [Russula dissimulans]
MRSPRRRDVASSLQLNGHVTPRSNAYSATQLIFALNSSRGWKREHAGFHYPTLYNFLVDYFEDAVDPTSKSSVHELLQWWNIQIFPSSADKSSGACSRSARHARASLSTVPT